MEIRNSKISNLSHGAEDCSLDLKFWNFESPMQESAIYDFRFDREDSLFPNSSLGFCLRSLPPLLHAFQCTITNPLLDGRALAISQQLLQGRFVFFLQSHH